MAQVMWLQSIIHESTLPHSTVPPFCKTTKQKQAKEMFIPPPPLSLLAGLVGEWNDEVL